MNRYRLNQILEILLLPLMDSKWGEQDYVLSCYQEYNSFNVISKDRTMSGYERRTKSNQYKKERKKLLEYLVECNHWRIKSIDDVEQIYDLYYSMSSVDSFIKKLKKEYLYHEKKVEYKELISYYYILEILPQITNSLITYRDGVAAIYPWIDKKDIFNSGSVFNKIEVWNLLSRMTVPDLYIAVAAVENNLGLEALYEQDFNLFLADKLLIKNFENGLAENHIHFNVGLDYMIEWLSYVDIGFMEEIQDKTWNNSNLSRVQVSIFRYYAAIYLEKEKKADFRKWLYDKDIILPEVYKLLEQLYNGCYKGNLSKNCVEYIKKSRRYYETVNRIVGAAWIWSNVAWRNYTTFSLRMARRGEMDSALFGGK